MGNSLPDRISYVYVLVLVIERLLVLLIVVLWECVSLLQGKTTFVISLPSTMFIYYT